MRQCQNCKPYHISYSFRRHCQQVVALKNVVAKFETIKYKMFWIFSHFKPMLKNSNCYVWQQDNLQFILYKQWQQNQAGGPVFLLKGDWTTSALDCVPATQIHMYLCWLLAIKCFEKVAFFCQFGDFQLVIFTKMLRKFC